MRLSTCNSCGQLVYFENTSCTRCGVVLGFNSDILQMQSFTPTPDGLLTPVSAQQSGSYRYCANGLTHNVCNWVVAVDGPHELCVACQLNRTIPDLGAVNNLQLWAKIESEKRRLIYSVLVLGLPLAQADPGAPQLAFDFLADAASADDKSHPVLTGHAKKCARTWQNLIAHYSVIFGMNPDIIIGMFWCAIRNGWNQ